MPVVTGSVSLGKVILLLGGLSWALTLAVAGPRMLALPTYAGFLAATGDLQSAWRLWMTVSVLEVVFIAVAWATASVPLWLGVTGLEVVKVVLVLGWRITTPGGDAAIMAGLAAFVLLAEARRRAR